MPGEGYGFCYSQIASHFWELGGTWRGRDEEEGRSGRLGFWEGAGSVWFQQANRCRLPPGSSINALCRFIVSEAARQGRRWLPLKLTTWNAAGWPSGNAIERH